MKVTVVQCARSLCVSAAGPGHPRFCDRCQERRVVRLTALVTALAEHGAKLDESRAVEFDAGRQAFRRGEEHGGPFDRRNHKRHAFKEGWEMERLLDMKAKGWP